MTLHKNLHWFIYALFLTACARQSAPTGGPKDTIPPVLVKATPPDETINFDASQLELIFSEDVILNSPKEQLIVTPTIGKEYEIRARKNTVVLEFTEPLQDSTTYTFNFRETVQDITEKNPVRNLTLAYSTGDYIDSLSISGTIYNMLRGKEVSEATVALHVKNDTFSIFEDPAVYFTKTNKQGRFQINHLKPGEYFVYAFQDKNRNIVINSRNESYGFLSQNQQLTENIDSVRIGLVNLDAGPLKMTSARPYNTYFNIRTTKNLRTFKLTATDSTDLVYAFGDDQANIKLYDTTEKDSIQIHVLAIDSIDNAIDTTLYAKFLTREVTPEEFRMTVTQTSLIGYKGQLTATIQFSKPVGHITFDSIYFQIDSLTRVNLNPENFTWAELTRELTLNLKMDPTLFINGEENGNPRRRQAAQPAAAQEREMIKLNELNLRASAFISIEHDSSETVVQNIRPLNEQDLSVINVGIRTNEESFIVQLIDNQYKVIRQVRNQHRVRFADVVPGEYQIRLIIDRNQNGRWDPGNYFENQEPEQVVYYRGADGTTSIKGVKANWEIGGDGEMLITY